MERLACVTSLVCGVPLGTIVAKKHPLNSFAKQVRVARYLFGYVADRRGYSLTEVGNFLGIHHLDTRRLRDLSREQYNNGLRNVVLAIERYLDNSLVYLSGKVSDSPYEHAVQKFNEAEKKLEEAGYLVVNPISLVPERTGWEFAMRILFPYLTCCDIICLLPDWSESRGATFEYEVAKKLGLKEMFYDECIK
ncbi:MAG: DUF4406 domain-containing protein [Fervidobacterium pennivorans]